MAVLASTPSLDPYPAKWHVCSVSVQVQVRDRQGGNQTLAQLYVVASATQGLLAFADSSELFNTAPITGVKITALLQAFL